ncbi:MAG TPA: CHC2 zinc finger domain-containing protein [Kiritimatiellia bacterium]|nr:CHC2 zinc finger domain-containing protein [Kiritimatiellia bacterium]
MKNLHKTDVALLRAAIDGDRARIASALPLQKQGIRYFCPFCQNDGRPHRTADLSVEAGFKCHKCGWHGDAFDLVRQIRNCSFGEAVAFIAPLYGQTVVPVAAPAKRTRGRLHPDATTAARAALWSVNSRTNRDHRETGRWSYHLPTGPLIAQVLRFDTIEDHEQAPAKTYVPIHVDGDGWRVGDPPGLWPLYNLPAIMASPDTVFVCEGEKAADAGIQIGLLCTTSAHGAKSPSKSDWTPLAGRDVVILPDNDPAGATYAEQVATTLLALDPPARVRMLNLPDLPEKGDLADYCEARDALEPAALRTDMLARAASAPVFVRATATHPSGPASASVVGEADYYDGGRKEYLIKNSEGTWLSYNESQYKRFLRSRGLSAKPAEGETLSRQDAAILDTQDKRSLVYAGLLAGWRAGVHQVPAGRILITKGPRFVVPSAGEWPTLGTFLRTLLEDDPAQFPTLMSWLKLGVESLASGSFRPGQVLAIAGPRNCGKSLLQKLLTELFGARFARPYAFMAGRTEFNKDLFEAEHLVVEDDVPSTRLEDRRNFGARIKEITANEGQRLHAKHRDALILSVFWRLSITVNDEPENLMILPPIDESLADKIMLFRARQATLPCETDTGEGRARCWQLLTQELPAFAAALQAWRIPDELISHRYGVRHFHHPHILQVLADLAPESKLAAILDAVLFPSPTDTAWSGTAAELERQLRASVDFGNEVSRLLSFNTACAVYLGRLSKRLPERYLWQHTRDKNVWLICPPRPVPSTHV